MSAVKNRTEQTRLLEHEGLSVKSVNWHVWPYCNYRCKFCFADFRSPDNNDAILRPKEGLRLITSLVEEGMQKITFVGGEPLLCPWLGEYVVHAKELGCITMIVSNGSLINERFLNEFGASIDWIGLSLDSGIESTEKSLGRGRGDHLSNLLEVAEALRQYDIKLKVNVTVTRAVIGEDLHGIIEMLQPDRLKFLQVLPIRGQNDEGIEGLTITRDEFYEFVEKHHDLNPVAEDNEMMRESYVMIDPQGRFFQNTQGIYKYSEPILSVGIWEALRQVGFSWQKLVKREGSVYFIDHNLDIRPVPRA